MSALASAFVDNIPLTTMMVKIAISLAENESLNLPLQPLVWALAFGACLGGKKKLKNLLKISPNKFTKNSTRQRNPHRCICQRRVRWCR